MKALMVAYPLLPVSEASSGGAEQVLWTLERELHGQGWKTTVAACAGSQVSGELLETGEPPHALDRLEEREREHTGRIVEECSRRDFDIILDHSGHFFRHARRVNCRVLATLHQPRSFYAEDAFTDVYSNVLFNCVSQTQTAEFSDVPRLAGVVRNGIALERFSLGRVRQNYVLWVGQVSPDKAPHLAVQAALRAKTDIVLAGEIYPFDAHHKYFEEQVQPLVDGRHVRWVRTPTFDERVKLLRECRAVLIPSMVAETDSLTAMEALACGTAVIAFGSAALSDVVVKPTGYIVNSVETMAAAIPAAGSIRARDCRDHVELFFSAKTMCEGYQMLLVNLAEQERWASRRS
jgi:glycosyltransferase involved in cell wall biosynthesis